MKKGIILRAGPGTRNRKEHIFEGLLALHTGYNFSSVLYIAPNDFVLAAARDLFFSYLKNKRDITTYIPFRTLTIRQLSSELHEHFSAGGIIPDRTRTLIMGELLKDKNIGYAMHLSELFVRIRHYIRDKELPQIKKDIRQLIFEEKTLKLAVDAIGLLELYERELDEKGLVDPEDILKESIPLINENINRQSKGRSDLVQEHPFSYSTLVIDGFFDPTPLELSVIETLTERIDNLIVMVEENTELDRHFRTGRDGIATERLKRNNLRQNKVYYSWPSIEEEVDGIAKSIKKHLTEHTAPADITVTFPSLTKYLPMVKRVFRRYEIPMSAGELNLSASAPLVALTELINSFNDDYPRNDFLSFITSPSFPGIAEVIRQHAVNFSYNAGIVKGKLSWLSLKDTIINTAAKEIPEEDREQLELFQEGINRIISDIEKIRHAGSLQLFIDRLESLLTRLGFFEYLAGSESTTQNNKIADRINRIFTDLRNLDELYGKELLSSDNPSYYLNYMLQNLKVMDDSRDSVRVLPYEIAAALETKILFLGGMTEGDFPSRPSIDPVLPEKVKKALGLPDMEYFLNRQQRYLTRLINIPDTEPYLSCPEADGDKIFLPSPYLDWEQKRIPEELNISSEEELIIYDGARRRVDPESIIFLGERKRTDITTSSALQQRMKDLRRGYFSVTEIDFYRRCPLRFYIERILGLEIDRPPKFEIESRLWGSLAHKTMENLFSDGDIDLEEIDDRLFQGLEKALKHFPIDQFWSKVAKEIFERLLPHLKRQEEEIRNEGFRPSAVESKLRAEIKGIKLQGKVDRVDMKAGKGEVTKAVRLIDYKTGTIDRESLQMPLYAALWKKNFPGDVEKAGYYSLKDGRISWLPKKGAIDKLIDDALDRAVELVSDIKQGIFDPEPASNNECRYCYHSPLCKKIS